MVNEVTEVKALKINWSDFQPRSGLLYTIYKMWKISWPWLFLLSV